MPALYLPLSLHFTHSLVTCLALADGELSLKDNARNKFGAGGQTLTPRHTIDAILGLKNRNAQGQQQQHHHQHQQQQLQPAQGHGQQQQQQQTEVSDGKCQVAEITHATVYRLLSKSISITAQPNQQTQSQNYISIYILEATRSCLPHSHSHSLYSPSLPLFLLHFSVVSRHLALMHDS